MARPCGVKDCAGGSGWYFGIIQLSLFGQKKIERCVKKDELLLTHIKDSEMRETSKRMMETSVFPLMKTSP